MKNNYTLILGMVLSISIISLALLVHTHPNQISFPFSGTVGVGPDTGSALTSILEILEEEVKRCRQEATEAVLALEFNDEYIKSDEYETIMTAALRNNCEGDDLLILFAIRKAENGPLGNEFGIMCQAGTDLDTQAGWAAATIMKNRERWNGEEDFIAFLGNRYCPPSIDPQGNKNWVKNVTYWFEKLKGK